MKRIAILGSTGSIGQSALAVVDAHPDRLAVVGLAAGENADRLATQIARYTPRVVAMGSGRGLDRLRALNGLGTATCDGVGRDGLVAVATHPDADIVLCASSGTEALEAVLAAILAGKTIALANKEVLVMAGAIITEAARRHGVPLLPVDSEHNAVHQCLHGREMREVRRIVLTASGGPFRGWTASQLQDVTAERALKHPTWRMGRKITIDSATLMNKGLEVIEARWLFGLPARQIDVVIHPQSIVHSMVEFVDGSIVAQLGVTDMRLPIQYACSYPERWSAPVAPLDLVRVPRLEFGAPDTRVFPCLELAYRALESEASLPVVLNAANEVAVALFLDGRLPFPAIAHVVEQTMNAHQPAAVTTIAEIRAVDASARQAASAIASGVK
ncbi:MAG: 1-deoxy-D-xylulose-5-phosphate reductoisomerase [Acidobacteriaceae bacterium]|jgi:1-deoxy-D-xylulose-5-phosphate reductoisomerase|nr:1-deoxy-D-xylulose-5-phosphate reductoisomerase [Acidobacteriaceae bacterium]